MRLWTWARLEKEFVKYPEKIRAFSDHPPKEDCKTFDEVLTIDDMQCDIVAEIIGCRCAENMRAQQKEVMVVRASVWPSPRAWIAYAEMGKGEAPPNDYGLRLQKIRRRYARAKQCHRVWSGKRAGIRCYCDEHNH